MPTSYNIDSTRNLVCSRGWGVLTTEDLYEHYAKMLADPRFDPGFRQLADLREVTALTIDATAIAQSAAVPTFDSHARRAIVASSDIAYGMSRMFSLYAESSGQTVQVFRTMEEANEWLDQVSAP